MSISEMEEFERRMDNFPHHLPASGHSTCYGPLQRVYSPPGMIAFRAGMYEHCGPDPIRAENMGDVERACKENGLTSAYAEDFGKSIFKTGRDTRWI